jgi:glycogen synthase
MRILHILDHSIPRRSGYATRTLSILKQQRALGWHTIHLTGPQQGELDDIDSNRDGWHFFRTEPNRSAWAQLPVLRHLAALNAMAGRLSKVVKLTRPDVLHAHPPLLNALAALRVGRRLGVPVVYEMRALWNDGATGHGSGVRGGVRRRLAQVLETYAATRADALATSCQGLRADMQARGVAAANITVVPDAVSIRHVDPSQGHDVKLARRLGLGSGPVVAYFGSFQAHEGLDIVLAAMPSLLRAHPSLQLLLAGCGPCEQQLKARAAELKLAEHVVFIGRIPRKRAAAYYSLADLLLYPRLATPLAELITPLKPLQAMAHGALVLASNVGGHRELIVHGKTGILFEAGSASGLADAVLSVLSEPGCWTQLRAAARNFATVDCSLAASVARYAPLYKRLIERKRAR